MMSGGVTPGARERTERLAQIRPGIRGIVGQPSAWGRAMCIPSGASFRVSGELFGLLRGEVRAIWESAHHGEVVERFMAPVLKTGDGLNCPWVRIPPSPPSGCPIEATRPKSETCEPSEQAGTDCPDGFSDKLTSRPGSMTRKRKRSSSIVEIGNGPARIKIYTMNRRDGYPEFTLSWKEAGRRKTRSIPRPGPQSRISPS